MPDKPAILAALQTFADSVTAKMTALTIGEPEDQLRAPFEAFMASAGEALNAALVCTGETKLPGRLGKPDYAVHARGLLVGYVEMKSPGTGADPSRFKGHNLRQWRRFQAIPNLLYCDGNEWGLYRNGERVRGVARLEGDVVRDGQRAVAPENAEDLLALLADFLSWTPIVPTKGKAERRTIDLKGLADLLAPLCRMLREDVADALKDPASPLVDLAKDWRQLLFPDADDVQFADAYAQTVTFALLLARSEGADPLTLPHAEGALSASHGLLSRALQVLTDRHAQAEISASLNLLLRVIQEVPPAALVGPEDPWLYFYEDFLASYDPELRKNAGAYYTPVEVVRAQVRLVDDLLANRLGKPLGFADRGVLTLDPAAGTGTYLLGVIDHALAKVEAVQGAGAVPGQASALAENLYGFEIMVGPFAVAELRVTRALEDRGARLPGDGTHVYLTDTLESPHMTPPVLPFFLRPIAEQHAKALSVKANVPVIVCLGNPPYDRHEAAGKDNKARTGHWVRWGEKGKGAEAIFRDFLDPAKNAGHGVHVKNLYNLYVYFWRWALWKVFETKTSAGPGIVSFITASSYLDGNAFSGMRAHMRRLCDEIWIVDLGGEGRGARKSENVFAIQTPVAVAVGVRCGKGDTGKPAKVHYVRIEGSRKEKLEALDAVDGFGALAWQECPEDWMAPFRPSAGGEYHAWPQLTDLLPWHHSGVQLKRTWPIAPDEATLEKRWRALLNAGDRAKAFRETEDRRIAGTYRVALTSNADFAPIAKLPKNAPAPPVVRYAYRAFDRQFIIADGRLMSRPRKDLWHVQSNGQVYLSSLFSQMLGVGPALVATALVPDLHHIPGGGSDIVPIYRDAQAQRPNLLPGLPETLATAYGRKVTPEDCFAYVYGILAHPAFTERFSGELGARELRVPITKDAALFRKVRNRGAKLLWLHTFGERFVPKGKRPGQMPHGKARCTRAVPGDAENYPDSFEYHDASQTLQVGAGAFAPVAREVYDFEVSGLKVAQSWLAYRMKKPKGKKSSPLDDIVPETWPRDFTDELLALLWVLEATLAEYPALAELLDAVAKGPCFRADELPPVPKDARKPLKQWQGNSLHEGM